MAARRRLERLRYPASLVASLAFVCLFGAGAVPCVVIAVLAIALLAEIRRTRVERRRLDAALALVEARRDRAEMMEGAVMCATEAVFFTGPVDEDGEARLTLANAAFGRLTAFPTEASIGRPISAFFSAKSDRGALAAAAKRLRATQAFRIELTMTLQDGSDVGVELAMAPVRGDGPDVRHWAGLVRDVTERKRTERALERVRETEQQNAALEFEIFERKRAESRLVHAAFHDGLTGLPNRALFVDRLQLSVERMRRGDGYRAGVLLIDCDRFKLINDSYGHGVGDLLLTAIARRLGLSLRSGDTLARVGSDAFTVLLNGIVDEADAENVALRLLEIFDEPFTLGEHVIYTTASVGIALGSLECESADDLVRDAEIAMYRAKKSGKERVAVFAADLREKSQRLLSLETELRRALERGDLEIAYQPIVTLDGRASLKGFEALVRWQHPRLGTISPVEFIPVAEETGMIVALGEIVLRRACAQMRAWQRRFPYCADVAVSVNVSAKQLLDPLFVDRVRAALAQAGLDARSLHLEVTESVLMSDSAVARRILGELHELGTEVHVDDFGTGYSSLAYLSQFHVDVVKIDRSFVSSQGSGVANPEIIMTVVTLAQHLGLGVTAEGIETAEQAGQLRALSCTSAQGYHFSRPLSVSAATSYIDAHDRDRTFARPLLGHVQVA